MNRPHSPNWANLTSGLLIAYVVVLATSTHWPNLAAGTADYNDKVAHFLAYAILGLLAGAAWAARRPWSWTSGLALWAAVALYGAIDELTQELVPGREAEVADWLADILGGLTGILLFRLALATWRLLVNKPIDGTTEVEF